MFRYAVALLAIFIIPLVASSQVRFGAEINLGSNSEFGLGVRGIYPLTEIQKGWDAVGSFNYYFWDGDFDFINVIYNFWEINFNGVLNIHSENKMLIPFVGGGLNLAFTTLSYEGPGGIDYSDSDTDLGLNLVGGSRFSIGQQFTPYAEARMTLGGSNQIVLTGGILF